MVYDMKQLEAAVETVMSIARDNLLKERSAHPCGLVFTTTGLAEELIIPDSNLTWVSEWTDGLWDHLTEGKE